MVGLRFAAWLAAARTLLVQFRLGSAVCDLKLVQWNIHGECFNRCGQGHWDHCDKNFPSCQNNSVDFVKYLLAGRDETPSEPPDFMGVEQMGDETFYRETANALGYGQIAHVCGGERGYGKYPFDVVILYFRMDRWKPVTDTVGGCMERVAGYGYNNYRAYAMAGFERTDGTGERVVVIVAHYSHSVYGIDDFGSAIRNTMQSAGSQRALMMADSNRECGTNSWRVVQDMLPETKSLVAAKLSHTCCVPNFEHCYDRIMAINFEGTADNTMQTMQMFGHQAPPWATVNMHDPVVSRFEYPGCDHNTPFAYSEPNAATYRGLHV